MKIGVRIKWIKILILFNFIMLSCVESWLLYSVIKGEHPDNLLIIMTIIVAFTTILMLVFTILNFMKKSDAITVDENEVIVKNYKTISIQFADIQDIRYKLAGARKNGSYSLGYYTYGTIIFKLKNEEVIFVNDIKNVKNVCAKLNEIILKE